MPSKKSKVRSADTKVNCPPIPVTPAFYDKASDMFYRVGAKGGIQRAKSRNGVYKSVGSAQLPTSLEKKLKHYQQICKSGDITELKDDFDGQGSFIMQAPGDRKNWYAVGVKGGLLVLRSGKTKWVSLKPDDAPLEVRIWRERIKERLKVEKQMLEKRRRDMKLNTWLAANAYVVRLDKFGKKMSDPSSEQLDDLKLTGLTDEELRSLWWDKEANQLLKRSNRSWNLVPVVPKANKKNQDEWNRINDGLRRARGVFLADIAMAIWQAQHSNPDDGAMILQDNPWIFVKEGPSTYSSRPWYKDFSKKNAGFKKVNPTIRGLYTQIDTESEEAWTSSQAAANRAAAKAAVKPDPNAPVKPGAAPIDQTPTSSPTPTEPVIPKEGNYDDIPSPSA